MKHSWIHRFVCSLLAGLMLMTLLAGCGEKASPKRLTKIGEEKEEEPEAEYEEEIPADGGEDGFPYLKKQKISDYNDKEAKYEIFMPEGTEVNDGFGTYYKHGIEYTVSINDTQGYESFENFYQLRQEYWPDPDTDYIDIYNTGIMENGDDRYFIQTGKGTNYEGTAFVIKVLEYMEVKPSGDCITWSLEMYPEHADKDTDLVIADMEKCYGIDMGLLKGDSQLMADTHDQDEYTPKEGQTVLEDLEGYQYLGTAQLSDYYGEGVCPVMMPRGYYTNVKKSHIYAFMHGIWATVDVEEFYNENVLLTELKSSVDNIYESRFGNTERIRNVWRSAMIPVPGFDYAFYTVISYEKKGYDTEEYFPKAEVLCYIQYDAEHYIALKLFLSGDKYDDSSDKLIQEFETAYGMDLSKYYKEGAKEEREDTADPGRKEPVTVAELIDSQVSKDENDSWRAGESTEPLPETVLWFNATYAPLTYSNGWDWKLIGGVRPTQENIEIMDYLLKQSWGVSDRDSALETVERLKEKGHRNTCRECMEELDEMGLLDLDEKEFKKALLKSGLTGDRYRYLIAYQMHQEGLDADAMAAWDLCRVNQLYASYYICGYMTYEEAMDASLENSLVLQEMYSSWDAMMEGYVLGYQFWQSDPDTKEDSPTKERRRMYEMMLQMEDNPYTLDWNMELQKSW